MKIGIRAYEHKDGTIYRADLKDLPGSPPCGEGKTKEEAIAKLFYMILHPDERTDWRVYIDWSSVNVCDEL